MGAKTRRNVLNSRLAAALTARNSISSRSICSGGFNSRSMYTIARIAGKKAKGLRRKDAPRLFGRHGNHFRRNTEMLAAWVHARRVEKAPHRSDEQTPAAATTASPPAPSSAANVVSTLNPKLWSPRANTTRQHRSALITGRRRSARSGGVFISRRDAEARRKSNGLDDLIRKPGNEEDRKPESGEGQWRAIGSRESKIQNQRADQEARKQRRCRSQEPGSYR
jgi:hypothetical protein